MYVLLARTPAMYRRQQPMMVIIVSWLLLMWSCGLIDGAVLPPKSPLFGTNLVQGGTAVPVSNLNKWTISSSDSDCTVESGVYTVPNIVVLGNYYCNMSQVLNVTFARDYYTSASVYGKVVATLTVSMKGPSGSLNDVDPAIVGIAQRQCTTNAIRGMSTMQSSDANTFRTYTLSMLLQRNVCSVVVWLYMENDNADGAKPYINSVSAVFTALSPSQSSSSTNEASLERTSTETFSLSPSSSASSTTTNRLLNRAIPSHSTTPLVISHASMTGSATWTTITSPQMKHSQTYFVRTESATRQPPAEDAVISSEELVRAAMSKATPVLQYSFGVVSSTGASIGRMAAVAKIGACQSPFAAPQGLFSFPIRGCNHVEDDADATIAAEYARGDATLALGAWVTAAAVVLACCVGYSHVREVALLQCFEELSMPSLLLPLWTVLLPTGLNGIAQLAAHSGGGDCAVDVVLLLFAVSVVIVLPFSLLAAGIAAMTQRLVVTDAGRLTERPDAKKKHNRVLQALDNSFYRQWLWVPRAGTVTSVHLYGRVVVLPYRLLWYAVFEVVVLAAVSVVGSVAVDRSLATCDVLGGVALALVALQLVVCCAARPFTTLFDQVVASTTLTLNVVAAAVQLALLHSTTTNLLIAAAALDLLLLGVNLLKTITDVIALGEAARRRCMLLLGRRKELPPPLCAASPLATHQLLDHSDSQDASTENVPLELLFDTDGAPSYDPLLTNMDDDDAGSDNLAMYEGDNVAIETISNMNDLELAYNNVEMVPCE